MLAVDDSCQESRLHLARPTRAPTGAPMPTSASALAHTTETHHAIVLHAYNEELRRLRSLTDEKFRSAESLPSLLNVKVVPGL